MVMARIEIEIQPEKIVQAFSCFLFVLSKNSKIRFINCLPRDAFHLVLKEHFGYEKGCLRVFGLISPHNVKIIRTQTC